MAIGDLPIFAMMKTKMHWHQTRQKLLAENVANADTPGFRPRDLKEMRGGAGMDFSIQPAMTSPMHLTTAASTGGFDGRNGFRFETTPSGNAVTLEEEMLKVAQNQADYQMATTLYTKSMQLLKTAIGRRA